MASSSDPSPHPPRPKAASRLIHSVKRTLSASSSSMPRKRYPTPPSKSGMRSTVAESAREQQHQFRDPDPHAAARPTVEQIAMGLHISRTPHLRPHAASPYPYGLTSAHHLTHPHPHPYPHPGHRPTPIALPPPPARSSMKKPVDTQTLTSSSSSPAVSPPFSSASASSGGSTTTVTSAAPSGSGMGMGMGSSHPRAFAAIKFRMSRFLPHSRSASAPSSASASASGLASSSSSSPDDSPRTSAASEYPPPRKKAVRFSTDDAAT